MDTVNNGNAAFLEAARKILFKFWRPIFLFSDDP